MREKHCVSYEVLLYIGSKQGYNGPSFTEEDLIREISLFQDVYPDALPVRISSCTYIAGSKYRENGHEISIIMYPNHLRSRDEINKYANALGRHLMGTFKQNRITMRRVWGETDVNAPGNWGTTMFESEEAEVSRSIQNFNQR